MVDEATELDVLEEDDRELIHSIFEFNETVVREVMIPRTDMITVDDDATVEAAMSVPRPGVSRMPVSASDADEVLGVVYLRDVARFDNEQPEGRGATWPPIWRGPRVRARVEEGGRDPAADAAREEPPRDGRRRVRRDRRPRHPRRPDRRAGRRHQRRVRPRRRRGRPRSARASTASARDCPLDELGDFRHRARRRRRRFGRRPAHQGARPTAERGDEAHGLGPGAHGEPHRGAPPQPQTCSCERDPRRAEPETPRRHKFDAQDGRHASTERRPPDDDHPSAPRRIRPRSSAGRTSASRP